MGILHSLRRIRRCESETAAQVVLEHIIKKEVEAALKKKEAASSVPFNDVLSALLDEWKRRIDRYEKDLEFDLPTKVRNEINGELRLSKVVVLQIERLIEIGR